MRTSLLNNQPELRSCETQKTSQLKAMTRILMAFFAMLLIPQVSWAQTEYDVFIGHYDSNSQTRKGITINSNNASDVKHDSIKGKVSFDHATRTLTLENAVIRGYICSYGYLTIDLKGSNIIYSDSSAIVNDMVTAAAAQNLTFKSTDGTGSLVLTSAGAPCVSGFNINYETGLSRLLGSLDTDSQPAFVGKQILSGGDGSTDSPYLISSSTDLKNLARCVNSGLLPTAGKNFKLIQTITLNDQDIFEPIGHRTKDFPNAPSFQGSFDGGGLTISNIQYDPATIYSVTDDGICLFRRRLL